MCLNLRNFTVAHTKLVLSISVANLHVFCVDLVRVLRSLSV